MQEADVKLDVVFVAACTSREIGEIFLHCGVKHVVCVAQGRALLDEAAILFTRLFYERLFKNREQICRAFDEAKNAVSFLIQETEANMFILLKEDQHRRQDCKPLKKISKGSWKCMSNHNLVKIIPAKLNMIMFREREMSKLLNYLLADTSDRIVPLVGLQGIGKSSLARNTLHFAAERKFFTRGILLVQLKERR